MGVAHPVWTDHTFPTLVRPVTSLTPHRSAVDTVRSPERITLPRVSTARRSQNHTENHTTLDTALNLRDVGGMPVNGGGIVRPRTLLRSGSLRCLSAADAAALLTEWNLRTVVDLRTPAELAADGPTRLADAGIATAHLPLMADSAIALSRMRGDDSDDGAVEALAQAYNSFVEHRGGHILTVARLLAWSADGSLLVHCSAGKDRTGVTIAILLDAVGVRRDAVIADYAKTNEVIDDVLDALARSPKSSISLDDIPLAARRAQPDALRAVLERLDRDFGGGAGWLRAMGLEPAESARLRRRLVITPHAA